MITRRDFIGGAASFAVLMGLGGTAKALGGQESLLRPPGGQDEDALLALCLRCDRCRSVCPTGCIGIGHVEDGLVEIRTPVMDFHRGECIFCNLCIQECPTGALVSFDKEHDRIGTAVIMKDRCVAWGNPGTCEKCKEACEYNAISIVDGIPVVDEGKCNGCGKCVLKCTALVYTSIEAGEARGIEVVPVDALVAAKEAQA